MIGFSQTIQYRIWLPRPSLEDLLNYKTYSDFPSLDKIGADLRLTRPVSQNLVPNSFFALGVMQINFHIFLRFFYFKIVTFVIIWTEFKGVAYQSKLGIGQNNLWREIFISTEKNNHIFWQVGYFKWRSFSSTLFLNPVSELRPCINFFLITLWNFLSFRVSLFVTSLEPPARTFYNLALFSIYGNDGTTISRRGVIINLKRYHWKKVQKGIPL